MKYIKIDKDGNFIKDVILNQQPTIIVDEIEVPDPQYIATPCKGAFYHPKWDGEQWVEGKTAEEIQAIIDANPTADPNLTESERIDRLELIVLQQEGVI